MQAAFENSSVDPVILWLFTPRIFTPYCDPAAIHHTDNKYYDAAQAFRADVAGSTPQSFRLDLILSCLKSPSLSGDTLPVMKLDIVVVRGDRCVRLQNPVDASSLQNTKTENRAQMTDIFLMKAIRERLHDIRAVVGSMTENAPVKNTRIRVVPAIPLRRDI